MFCSSPVDAAGMPCRRATMLTAALLLTSAAAAEARFQCSDRALNVEGLNGAYLAGDAGDVSDASTGRILMGHNNFTSLASACDRPGHPDPQHITQIPLLGRTLSFTADLSHVGCACNLAVYLVAAPARHRSGAPNRGRGDFYCDANKVGGHWCPEIDLMEANNHAFQATPHKCDPPVGDHHYTSCDRGGCAQNTRDMANAYGMGENFIIDTRHPFEVRSTFEGDQHTFTGFRTVLSQGGRQVVLDHSNCNKPYLASLSESVRQGMSLILSYWGKSAATMAWMDSPPCGQEVCQGANAGLGVISKIAVSEVAQVPVESPGRAEHPMHPRHTTAPPEPETTIVTVASTQPPLTADGHIPELLGPIHASAASPAQCLTLTGAPSAGGSTSGAQLVLAKCDAPSSGAQLQLFRSRGGDGRIRWGDQAEYCVTAREGSDKIRLLLCEGEGGSNAPGQAFSFFGGDRRIRLASRPGHCLDAGAQPSAPVAVKPVLLLPCHDSTPPGGDAGGDGQLFTWSPLPDVASSPPPPPPTTSLLPTTPSPTTTTLPTTTMPIPTTTTPFATTTQALPTPAAAPAPPATTKAAWPPPALYNCNGGRPTWPSWSWPKRAWCCRHHGSGCDLAPAPSPVPSSASTPAPPPRASVSEEPYDCDFGFPEWVPDWADDKKVWCCSHRQRGCSQRTTEAFMPATTTTGVRFTCFSFLRDSWTTEHRDWCCQTRGVACPTTTAPLTTTALPTTTAPPMTTVLLTTTVLPTTAATLALAPTPPAPSVAADSTESFAPVVYDCDWGYSDWRSVWSAAQAAWCCKREGKACVADDAEAVSQAEENTYDCNDHFWDWRLEWTEAKKRWCCRRQGRGCQEDVGEGRQQQEDDEGHYMMPPRFAKLDEEQSRQVGEEWQNMRGLLQRPTLVSATVFFAACLFAIGAATLVARRRGATELRGRVLLLQENEDIPPQD